MGGSEGLENSVGREAEDEVISRISSSDDEELSESEVSSDDFAGDDGMAENEVADSLIEEKVKYKMLLSPYRRLIRTNDY